jgi:hypothetical protein
MTHRENVLKRFGLPLDTQLSIKQIAKLSGIPIRALYEVRDRGFGAYYNGDPKSVRMKGTFKKGVDAPMSMKLSPQQWAVARIYSFVDKGTTYRTTDADIARKYGV